MVIWRDVAAVRERTKELLLEAEKERLIQQMVVGREEPAAWQKVRGLLAGLGKKKGSGEEELRRGEQRESYQQV